MSDGSSIAPHRIQVLDSFDAFDSVVMESSQISFPVLFHITQMYIGQAKSFLADGVQVQALGVQSHFNSRPRGPLILKRLDRLAAAGLPLWVTELDYADSSDQELADALKDALLAFFRLESQL